MGSDSPFPVGPAPAATAMGQPPAPSFEHHPGLRGRQEAAYELAEELRRLIDLSVSTAPPAEETAALAATLRQVADQLERHRPEVPLPRFLMLPPEDLPRGIPLGGAMPYDPIVGPFNPLAVPVRLAFEPPKALGYATFGVAYEGAPGCVHGSALLATFDIILTGANTIAGATGPTVRLGLHFRRPTLAYEEAVFEGWVTEVTERRIFSKGQVIQGGVVTVEAEGEFAILGREGVDRMASVRRHAFETKGSLASEGPDRADRLPAEPWPRANRSSPSRDPADYAFSHRLRTRFAETDAMGVIHHGSYLLYMEEARVAYLAHLGHPYGEVRDSGAEFPVLEVSVQYRRPLHFDDEVAVHLWAGAVTGATFQIAYLLTVDGQPCATAVSVHGCVDGRGRGGTRLPAWVGETFLS